MPSSSANSRWASGLERWEATATAQTAAAATQPVALGDASVTPRVTVRLHAGPSLNLMSDWRSGLNTLWKMTEARGLSPRDKSCICMSWGSTVLVHATERVALGGAFEMLRDTREFTVTDSLQFFGPPRDADFGFGNEVVVQTKQIVELQPMSPHDRRIVHMAISEIPGLSTRSEGEGEDRHILVVPTAAQ